MTDDELPIFRPRFGSRRISSDDRGLTPAVLSRVASLAKRRGSGCRARFATPPTTPQSRRVVIKARYVPLTANGKRQAALHLRYIQRDGVERDGSPGVLYGATKDVSAASFELPRPHEERQFRLIVAPEDANELDLTAYVRSLMARVERDIGQPLEWGAVNHHNTAHPHAHVVVRGVDREGRQVRFDRQYIARGMRERAQELATQELGPRSPDLVRRTREREVRQERFTSLDRQIDQHARDGTEVRRADLDPPGRRGSGELLLARMQHLERMRLAERTAPNAWRLAPDWAKQLRALGERDDIVKQMHAAVRGDPARYCHMDPGQALPGSDDGGPSARLHGHVRAKALTDEMRGTLCAIVETSDGAAYRVPIDARAAESLRVGDLVILQTVPRTRTRPEDSLLEALARAGGGRCAPPSGTPAPGEPDLARRLRQLERLGLAQRAADGVWSLQLPLKAALEQLDRERPEHRLLLRSETRSLQQQVATRGPVWLDRLDPSALSPHGLGAELRPWVERRAETLRAWGIRPDDPKRAVKLQEHERRAVGERAATDAGLEFHVRTPSGFQGRVQPAPDAPHFALISDGQRLAVVPMTRDLRAAVGRSVTLSVNARGHVRAVELGPER